MSEHTATPWRTEEFDPCLVIAPDGETDHQVVGVTYGDDSEASANAAFIVRAVNAHDALVEALDRLTTAAASIDNLLHAGFSVSEISTEQSRLYNEINHAKAVLFEAQKSELVTA